MLSTTYKKKSKKIKRGLLGDLGNQRIKHDVVNHLQRRLRKSRRSKEDCVSLNNIERLRKQKDKNDVVNYLQKE